MNRQLRPRVRLRPSADWPSAPSFGLQMLPADAFSDASFDAITCIDCHQPFPRSVTNHCGWARLLKIGGRLLFTDPTTVTGALTNAEIAVRSSAGFYRSFPMAMTNALLGSADCDCWRVKM